MKKNDHQLWIELTSFENLLLAFSKAARGKRSKPDVAEFEFNLEPNLLQIQVELRKDEYQPGKYHSFYIHDPKKRLISAAPFRDRVVHHAPPNFPRKRKFLTPRPEGERLGEGLINL